MVRYWVCVCVELHISYISYHGRFIHILCKCHAGTLQSCYGDFICICLQYPGKTSHPWVLYPSRARFGQILHHRRWIRAWGWSMSKKLPSIARNIWSMSTLIASVSFYQIKTTLINVHDPTAQLWTCCCVQKPFCETWTFRIHIKITWIFWTYDWRIGCIRSTNPRPLHAVFRSFMIDLFPSVSFMSIWGRDCPSFCRNLIFLACLAKSLFFFVGCSVVSGWWRLRWGRDRCHPIFFRLGVSTGFFCWGVCRASWSWVCVLFNMSTTTWPGSGGGAEEGPPDLAGVATVRRSSCGSCFTGTWHWPEGAGCWTSCGAGTWANLSRCWYLCRWCWWCCYLGRWCWWCCYLGNLNRRCWYLGRWCWWCWYLFLNLCRFSLELCFLHCLRFLWKHSFPLVIHLPLPRPFFLLPLLVWCFAGFCIFPCFGWPCLLGTACGARQDRGLTYLTQ